MPDPDFIEF